MLIDKTSRCFAKILSRKIFQSLGENTFDEVLFGKVTGLTATLLKKEFITAVFL